MLRWTLLVFALGSVAFGLLNVVPSPRWSPWPWAVLAGEYGHWVAPLPVAIALGAWFGRRKHPRLAGVSVSLAAVAFCLLLKPASQAARIGQTLPGRLSREFGDAAVEREPFSLRQFFGADPELVPVESLEGPGALPIDFYRALRTDGRPAPCVVVVHGGGWNAGDRRQLPQLNHSLARRGYAVAAISYRLAPKFRWPAQREDTLAAIAWLKARASELGIDPTRLVLLGRSAGGQIAQTVGYTARDPAIRGVIAFYAPSDLHFGYVNTHENDMIKSPQLMRQYLGGPPETTRVNYDDASALNHVTRSTPPTLLLHGENDTLVWHRHSVRLEARLRENGVPCVFVSLPWATHAFDYTQHGPGGQLARFAIEWFLAATTR